MDKTSNALDLSPIAIVGMSLRVPGADALEQYWSNLRNGVESVTFFTDDELRARGVDEAALRNPDYVKAMGRLEGIEQFDARFFEMTPREAEILDPQHRILMETVWRALEHASIDPERFPGRIGMFAGVGLNAYLLHNLLPNQDLLQSVGGWQLNLGNDKDFATTRIAYKFNFQGPAISMNTACSTSLVATALAAQSLQSHQCDVVIAGGCSIHLPQDEGYTYIKGGTVSPDGHCRPFDVHSAGTIDGNGAAVVVLKRLEDAIADRDTIHAVIHGYAINNDGSLKVGYTAPSVEGQSDVIREAMEMAGLTPDRIGFIETHGTATELGDSIEIAALGEAFADLEDPEHRCVLGAVKSNIGHLDTAAGAAGLIKAALAIRHGEIPPTCHFTAPNPTLRLEQTPFRVTSSLEAWTDHERYAGVSSFGIGGTNAHVILGPAPIADDATPAKRTLCFPLTAQTPAALARSAAELAAHLRRHPELDLQDVAYTLQQGRRHFPVRVCAVMASTRGHEACLSWLENLSHDVHKQLSNNALIIFPGVNGSESSPLVDALRPHLATWLEGEQIDWELVADASSMATSATSATLPTAATSASPVAAPRRVPIPGHPFERQRYWIDALPSSPASSEPQPTASASATQAASQLVSASSDVHPAQVRKDPDLHNWFYLHGWTCTAPAMTQPKEGARWLVIMKQSETEAGPGCSPHSIHATFQESLDHLKALKVDVRTLTIPDPIVKISSDWALHLDALKDWVPDHIVDASLLSDPGDDSIEQTREVAATPAPFKHMMSLGRALGQRFFSEEIVITLLCRDITSLSESGRWNPSLASALGPLKVMPQEYPNLSTRALDIQGTVDPVRLASELCDLDGPRTVLLNRGGRWVETFERMAIHEPGSVQSRLRQGGTYLITGGLGQIGLALARHLASTVNANMVLTGRSPLQAESEWDDLIADPATSPETSRRLLALKELQSLGSDVLYVQADASNLHEMEQSFTAAEERFGRIDGIIHAAGIVGEASFLTIHDSTGIKGEEAAQAQFLPKVRGTEVLASLLEHRKFDFCLICSSLSPILGGLGFSAYAATNLQADVLVMALNARQPGKWLTVNWEGWMFDHESVPGALGASSAFELGMTASEGVDVFTLVMNQPHLDKIVISSGPLDRRLAQWVQRRTPGQGAGHDATQGPHASQGPHAQHGPIPQGTIIKRAGHARPDLLGEAVPASTDTQLSLTAIWEELLGIDGIGIHDGFFELGGNSLLLTQMVAMMRRTFRVELALSALFEHPTIERIAEQIETTLGAASRDDREEGVL